MTQTSSETTSTQTRLGVTRLAGNIGAEISGVDSGGALTIIERPEDLLLDVFGWSDLDLSTALGIFAKSVLRRLREIEAPDISLARWTALTGTARKLETIQGSLDTE